MPAAKFRHIALTTPEPEKLAAWYKETFGLEEVDEASEGGIYLTDGNITFEIVKAHPNADGSMPRASVSSFGLVVDDPKLIYRKLEETGCEQLSDTSVQAPDGLRFDISERGWPGTNPA